MVAEPSLFGIFYCVCDVVGLFVSVFGGLVAVQTGAAARFVVANNSAGNVGWCVGVVGGCGERGGGAVNGVFGEMGIGDVSLLAVDFQAA